MGKSSWSRFIDADPRRAVARMADPTTSGPRSTEKRAVEKKLTCGLLLINKEA